MTSETVKQQENRRTLKSLFPILEWLPKYEGSWIRLDLIAALTLWAVLVPEAMAYAGIAGMPPETGLYAAPLALIAYAIFGTSRHLDVGPSSAVAALSFSIVAGLAVVGSPEFIILTIALALVVGIFLIIGGFLKMGVLADFLSRPVLDTLSTERMMLYQPGRIRKVKLSEKISKTKETDPCQIELFMIQNIIY